MVVLGTNQVSYLETPTVWVWIITGFFVETLSQLSWHSRPCGRGSIARGPLMVISPVLDTWESKEVAPKRWGRLVFHKETNMEHDG